MSRLTKLLFRAIALLSVLSLAYGESTEAPLKMLDTADAHTDKLEVRHSMIGYRSTLLFYTFNQQKAVLKLEIGNQDTTFPVGGVIYFFDDQVTGAELKKWLNNQHSDGLFTDIPRPVHTRDVPAGVGSATSYKLIDQSKEPFGEYDNYAVTVEVKGCRVQPGFKLKGFTVDTKVHVKTK